MRTNDAPRGSDCTIASISGGGGGQKYFSGPPGTLVDLNHMRNIHGSATPGLLNRKRHSCTLEFFHTGYTITGVDMIMNRSSVEETCPACDGTGRDAVVAGDRNENEPCMNCDGIGTIGRENDLQKLQLV